MVRPRGWHLRETHVTVAGRPVPGALFDFCLYFFHNAATLHAKGSGPYFYLPKMQSHLEARLWNEVFIDAQAALGIPRGTIKVSRGTFIIEGNPAEVGTAVNSCMILLSTSCLHTVTRARQSFGKMSVNVLRDLALPMFITYGGFDWQKEQANWSRAHCARVFIPHSAISLVKQSGIHP